jgi:hypothetical protein
MTNYWDPWVGVRNEDNSLTGISRDAPLQKQITRNSSETPTILKTTYIETQDTPVKSETKRLPDVSNVEPPAPTSNS